MLASMDPPAVKPPRLKRKRTPGRRKVVAAPSATRKKTHIAALPPIPPPEDTTTTQPDDASCTALSIPEPTADLKSFCHAYRPPPRAAAVTLPPEAPDTTHTITATATTDPPPAADAGPVVTIVDGEIVLQAPPRRDRVLQTATTVVEDETETAIIHASYDSFTTRRDNRGWTVEETKFFYEALRQVGLDFGTMETLFADAPSETIRKRTRVQLKNKHRRENNQRPDLVYQAVWGNRPKRDMSTLALVVATPAPETNVQEAVNPGDGADIEGTTNERTVTFSEDASPNEEIPTRDRETTEEEANDKEEDPFESEPIDEEEYWGL